jgi:hypothetical protein
MSLGHINLIIHEVQKEHSMELSNASKRHIERLLMAAVQKENENLEKDKSYWMNKYLNSNY